MTAQTPANNGGDVTPPPEGQDADDVADWWIFEAQRDELLNVLEALLGLLAEGAFDAAVRLVEQVLAEHSDGGDA